MLDHQSEIQSAGMGISPRKVDLYFLEGDGYTIALEIPSQEEIELMRGSCDVNLSVSNPVSLNKINYKEHYLNERNRFLLKMKRYENSATYYTRLANLSNLAVDHDSEIKYFERAVELDGDQSLKHALASAYLGYGENQKAKSVVESCELSSDTYANLKIAYIYALDKDIKTAETYVMNALSIDELDADANMFYGTICLWKREFQKAISRFKIAAQDKPKSSALLVNMAFAYWNMNQRAQAFETIRRAVALNPLSENALAFYADIAHSERLDEGAIPALRKYLEFERSSEGVWERFARACYCSAKRSSKRKEYLEYAFDALRHQEALNSGADVWNNLGVVVSEMNRPEQAERYYAYAIKKCSESRSDPLLPVHNLSALYIKNAKFKESIALVKAVVATEGGYKKGVILDKIKVQFVVALDGCRREKEALEAVISFLEEGVDDKNIKLDLLSRIYYYYAIIGCNKEITEKYLDVLQNSIADKGLDRKVRSRAINNVSFYLINEGRMEEAEHSLKYLSNDFHKDPYSTATLGMAKIRKGLAQEGEALYREAISLLSDEKDKSAFRQRMHFELGKIYAANQELTKSLRAFEKSLNEKYGLEYIGKKVREEIQNLKRLR